MTEGSGWEGWGRGGGVSFVPRDAFFGVKLSLSISLHLFVEFEASTSSIITIVVFVDTF